MRDGGSIWWAPAFGLSLFLPWFWHFKLFLWLSRTSQQYKPTPKNFKDGANLLFRGLVIANAYASSMSSWVSYRFQIDSSYTCGRAKTMRKSLKWTRICFEKGKKVAFSNEYGYEWTEPKSHSFIHEPRKRQIRKLSRANCLTIQLTVRAWSHEPGKQCAWTVCYSLSCFLLGSFSGPPGKRDFLENCHPGTRYHNTGIPANRAGWVVI